MVNRPRWLSTATLAVIFSVIVVACTPAAGPTSSPSAAPTGTPKASGTAAASGTPAATGTAGASATASGSPAATGTPAPTGTAYPSAPKPAPVTRTTITDTYPNYGDPVDCKAGSWNGLPYAGNLKSLTAPDDHTVVFTFCNPDVAFLSKIAFSVFAINDSSWLDHAHRGR